jgi:glycosyltransferase involved in cell wall biosynthesis
VDWQRYAQPCDRTAAAVRLGVSAGGLWIAVVAQLIERKGHRFLLRALPPLLADYPDLRVIFFGQGPLAADLAAEAQALGVAGHLTLAGFRDDLETLLPCLDLLVHPALMEGLGVSLLQAASAGVPILANRAGGIPEAVRDGENGVLVPPGDVDALGAALRGLLADPERRRALGAAGQALMAREFSIDAMVEGNLAVYRELLAAHADA